MSARADNPGQTSRIASRREWLAVGALVLSGFALRVIFVIAMEEHPPHQVPILDSAFHVGWARAIAAGEEYAPLADRPFFRAPLYAWFLAGIFALCGQGLLVPRLIQCALGAASIGLVYLVGKRAFEPRAGFLAGAIAATYWLLIYFDGELMSETLVVTLILFALWLTLGLASAASRARAACVGLAWGVTALARPNVLLFVPFVPIWLLWIRRPRAMRGLVPAALFAVGVLVPILPVTAYNTFAKGDFALIASYGGINLWIGNNPQSNGIDAFVPGSRSGWWEGYYDAIAIAERARGRSLRASEVSRYYSELAWNFIWHHPAQSIPLFGRKFALFWAGEYGNNEPESFVAHRYSWVPDLSIGYGALAPLGLLGFVLSRREATRLFPLWGFFATYMASLVAFFVSSRYRVPILPVLMVFAGHALVRLSQQVGTRQYGRAGAEMLFVLGFCGWALTQGPDRRTVEANGHLLLGRAEMERGRYSDAAVHLRRAIELEPHKVDALVALAWIERSTGDPEAAIEHYRLAVSVAPLHDVALEGLLDLAIEQGRASDAEQWIDAYLERLTQIGVNEPETPFYYRGRIHAARGEPELARRAFAEALRRDPHSFRAALELGDLEREAGRWAGSAASYRRALFGLRPHVASEDDGRAYRGLVDALERLGRTAEACRQASAWQTRHPQSAAARDAQRRLCD